MKDCSGKNNTMNITCFIASLTLGGAERQLIILASMLSERGHNITIVTYSDVKDHYIVPSKINRVILGKGQSRVQKYWSVLEYFRHCNDDCIISYMQNCNVQVCVSMMLRGRPRPTIICGERNLTYWKPDIYERLLFNWLYRYADFIVPNSYSQAKYMNTKCPKWGGKVRTILNYTDVHGADTTYCKKNSVFRIAVFGRYDYQKNCLLFAKALANTKRQVNNRFIVDWYGDKCGSVCYSELVELVNKLGINDVFSLNDSVPEPMTIMHKYNAICLPSLFEGFSNSIAEAICCGKPMIVSDVSDNSIMVQNGVNGFLFDPLDINSISSAILQLIACSEDRLTEMSYQSRRIAEELFDSEKFINQYLGLIEHANGAL